MDLDCTAISRMPLPPSCSHGVRSPLEVHSPRPTTTASSDYETAIGFYNVLNSGNANLTNEPLKPKSVTLSRTDLIAFQ